MNDNGTRAGTQAASARKEARAGAAPALRWCPCGRWFIWDTKGRGGANRTYCLDCRPIDEHLRRSWRESKRRHYLENKIRRATSA